MSQCSVFLDISWYFSAPYLLTFRITQESEASSEESRMTKATLRPRIPDSDQRSAFVLPNSIVFRLCGIWCQHCHSGRTILGQNSRLQYLTEKIPERRVEITVYDNK